MTRVGGVAVALVLGHAATYADPITNRTSTGVGYQSGHHITVGDPVSTFSGKEVFSEAPDFNLGGPGIPVFFQRHYDGGLFADGVVQSALGRNWQHNWDIRLNVAGTNATLALRQGRVIRFEHDGAAWNLAGRREVGFQLIAGGGGFLVGDPRSQMMYRFNAGGLLTRIEDGRGNTNFLFYNDTLLTNINDGLNRALSLAYDGSGLLTNVSDGTRSVSFTHSSSNLVSATDANGKTTTYAYDLANTNNPALLTARTLPQGNAPFTQTYNPAGRVVLQIDAAGGPNQLAYASDALTFATTTTDPLGHTATHVYNNVGELTELLDESGNSILAFQDDTGRRNAVMDRKGNTTLITYDPDSGLPTEIRPPPGNVRDTFIYSNRTVNGLVFKDLALAGHQDFRTNRYSYDASGNLTEYVLRDGASFHYAYNNRGQVTSATNPVGGIAIATYDASARLASASDSDVGATLYEYDSFNRLTNITHPNPDTVQFTYDVLDRLTSVTDERGHSTRMAYDHNSRLTAITNALNQTARFEYDAMNRLTRSTDRLGHTATFGYDPRTTPDSLLASVTNRNGFVTRYQYDSRRRLTGIVNPAGKTNRLGYDPEGLLIAATNPVGETVTLGRDVMGYVTRVSDSLGNSVGLQLDTMKRVIGVTNAFGNKTIYAYTPRGQLQSVMLPNGIRSTNRYDGLGALTNLVDPNNRQWNFARTPMGRLAALTDPLNRTNLYAYDVRGRLTRVTYPDGVTLTNTYDGANNLLRRQYSDGTDLNFAYDALNRLTNATGSDPIEFGYDAIGRVINTRQVGLDFGATFDADGRLTSVSYNNGLFTVTYGYDSRDRLTSVADNLTGTTMTFNYDDANRLTGITRPNGVNTTYSYDAAGRLRRIQDGGVTNIINLQFTLDAAGRITRTDYAAVPLNPADALTTENTSFTYDAASQISTGGYSYDARGRQTSSPGNTFTWDSGSRLRSINGVNLGYNALSDLVTREEAGNTNRYFYNYAVGLNPIMAERNDNTGQFTRFHVWSPGGLLLYIINLPGNTVSFPHFDQVGSTLALTGAGGTVTDSYAYDPYGRVLGATGSSPQPFRFVGRYGARSEPAAGLNHLRARYLDPLTARFLGFEPIWPALDNPRKLNPYQYAIKNPLYYVDRTGEESEAVASLQHLVANPGGEEVLAAMLAIVLRKDAIDTVIEGIQENNAYRFLEMFAAHNSRNPAPPPNPPKDATSGAGETPAAAPPRQRKPIWPNPRPRTVTIQAGLFEASSPGALGAGPGPGAKISGIAVSGYSSDAAAKPQNNVFQGAESYLESAIGLPPIKPDNRILRRTNVWRQSETKMPVNTE